MSHPLAHPVHTFHIPVMGTGFTIGTPLKVARYGISSVISLVDDALIEQMRQRISEEAGEDFIPIDAREDDARARRITAYLDLLDRQVTRQVARLRASVFETGSEITRYFELLPTSPLRALYERMRRSDNGGERDELQAALRQEVAPGAIDVNIMTKLDQDRFRRGGELVPQGSDALSALRGYARSGLRSSVVLSAGLNRRLFSYLGEFDDFFPDGAGEIRKRIILKVNDFRSAHLQGNLLARLGLWVSEYRVESGLNCGGHAFGGKGQLLGPVLAEFRRERLRLTEELGEIRERALAKLGRAPADAATCRITVQGGIGTAGEDAMLRSHYAVDGTGWASPFLLCPEVVSIDDEHLKKVSEAREEDVVLSDNSPLGVPFWNLRTSASEVTRRARIDEGNPGSPCPKGYLVSNTEFTKAPICTASRAYQRRKLGEIAASAQPDAEKAAQWESVVTKACICHDLGGVATVSTGIDPHARAAVCCGPNTVYFSRVASLRDMVDHIYDRAALPLAPGRPHMFLKELSLHVERARAAAGNRRQELICAAGRSATETKQNLLEGIRHYREVAAEIVAERREEFLAGLESLREELERLLPEVLDAPTSIAAPQSPPERRHGTG